MLGEEGLGALIVSLELDDGAASGPDLHLYLVAACVIAFDLPDAVVQLDFLDVHDALVEGHHADSRC